MGCLLDDWRKSRQYQLSLASWETQLGFSVSALGLYNPGVGKVAGETKLQQPQGTASLNTHGWPNT